MTLEEHLRRMVGDLVLTVARQAAEIDTLRAAAATKPTPDHMLPKDWVPPADAAVAKGSPYCECSTRANASSSSSGEPPA